MRRLYTLLTSVVAPFAFGWVLLRALRDPAYRTGLDERFGLGAALPGAAGAIWLHAVSLGEVTAAVPLLRELRVHYPDDWLVVTTATPTGRARALSLGLDRLTVRYLPYDLPAALRRFLARLRPRVLIVMETELWPNLYRACAERGLPVLLASARMSARSARRYAYFGSLFRDIFTAEVIVAAQTADDAARFVTLGSAAARTPVVGNLKFDIQIDPEISAAGRALRAALFGARPVWVAGSTHPGEEEEVLDAHTVVLRAQPDALLLLAPRHPQRFDAVAALLGRRGLAWVRRSAGRAVAAGEAVFLIDTVGELLKWYAAGDVAFVGGSLVPIGGHNLLEPAALGLAVVTGPSDANGREIAALLLRAGAVARVATGALLGERIAMLLGDATVRGQMGAAGSAVVRANRGGVARLVALVRAQCP